MAQVSPSNIDRILVVGGGIAGSLLALVLARAGHAVTVFDPNRKPKPTFRNEKLGEEQIDVLRELGVLECFDRVCRPPQAYAEKPKLTDCGAHHHHWVASVRKAWPDSVEFIENMVESVETGPEQQTVTIKTGERFTGRLVVLASGRMTSLRNALGIRLKMISSNHSACLGFSVSSDRFISSQVFVPRQGSGIGYVSIFPMPGETRVNIFSFRSLSDPWTRRMANDPVGGLAEISPEAADWLRGASLRRRCEARGTDLYAVRNHRRDGLVLIGDAFHAPCPASGTGMLRVLYDINLLANHHLPKWMTTPGMARSKIDSFYRDPAKRWLDRTSLKRSLRGRSAAFGSGLYWTLRRALREIMAHFRLTLPSESDRLPRLNTKLRRQNAPV